MFAIGFTYFFIIYIPSALFYYECSRCTKCCCAVYIYVRSDLVFTRFKTDKFNCVLSVSVCSKCFVEVASAVSRALLYPRQSVELDMKYKNIMSVNVPIYNYSTKSGDSSDIYPYGFAQTSGELDDALEYMSKVFEDMLKLAEVEKTMQLLAEEIEKTRRRVNALEYVMIPDLEKNIKYITLKLEENENATKVRLLKVKEMVLEKAHGYNF